MLGFIKNMIVGKLKDFIRKSGCSVSMSGNEIEVTNLRQVFEGELLGYLKQAGWDYEKIESGIKAIVPSNKLDDAKEIYNSLM